MIVCAAIGTAVAVGGGVLAHATNPFTATAGILTTALGIMCIIVAVCGVIA